MNDLADFRQLDVDKLPEMDSRDKRVVVKAAKMFAEGFSERQQGYWKMAEALDLIREEGVWQNYWPTLESAWKAIFGVSKQWAYRLLDSYQARQVALSVEFESTMVYSAINERQARELSKVETDSERADLFAAAVEKAEESGKRLTAKIIADTRKEKFPENWKPTSSKPKKPPPKPAAEKPPELWQQLAAKHKEWIGTINTLLREINKFADDEKTGQHIQYCITRIRADLKTVKGTISQSMPVGMRRGKILTKGEQQMRAK